jgi:hypothetical protein
MSSDEGAMGVVTFLTEYIVYQVKIYLIIMQMVPATKQKYIYKHAVSVHGRDTTLLVLASKVILLSESRKTLP